MVDLNSAKPKHEDSWRKLLQQKDEKLQQQVHSLQAKEATLTRTNSEMSHRTQELESELNTAREEQRSSQKSCHRLEEQLLSSQHESERLQEELKLVDSSLTLTSGDTMRNSLNTKPSCAELNRSS